MGRYLYDDFDDNSENAAKFNYVQGVHSETGGKQRLDGIGGDTVITSENKAGGHGIYGLELDWSYTGGGTEGPDRYAGITNAANDSIRVRSQHAVGNALIEVSGAYGSGSIYSITGSSGALKIVEEGGVVKVYWAGTLRWTGGVPIQPNSWYRAIAQSIGGTENYETIDNLYFYTRDGGAAMFLMD